MPNHPQARTVSGDPPQKTAVNNRSSEPGGTLEEQRLPPHQSLVLPMGAPQHVK